MLYVDSLLATVVNLLSLLTIGEAYFDPRKGIEIALLPSNTTTNIDLR